MRTARLSTAAGFCPVKNLSLLTNCTLRERPVTRLWSGPIDFASSAEISQPNGTQGVCPRGRQEREVDVSGSRWARSAA